MSGSDFNQVSPSPTPISFNNDDQDTRLLSSTVRPTDEERADTIKKLMKDEEKESGIITQFYPDYEEEDYDDIDEEIDNEEQERKTFVKSSTPAPNRIRIPNIRPKFSVSTVI